MNETKTARCTEEGADLSTKTYPFNKKQQEQYTQLLSQLVAIPSENPPGNEAPCIDFLASHLQRHGIAVHRVPSGLAGRESLIALVRGRTQRGLIFTGHTDVVPVHAAERQRWLTDPFVPTIKQQVLYGRGSCDMKSGLAAAVFSLCALVDAGEIPARDIALVITVDEEDGMQGSRNLFQHPLLEDFHDVVVCEPTNLTLCSKSRGRTYGYVTCQGKTAHASQPGSGTNAILIAHDFIDAILKEDLSAFTNDYGSSYIRPLGIHANVDPWVIPDECVIKLDARLTLGHNPTDIWERVRRIEQNLNERYAGNALLSHSIVDAREPWETKDVPLVHSVKHLLRSIGLSDSEHCFPGTTDGTPLRRAQREVIILGPGDLSCAHQENEHVDLKQCFAACNLYRSLMHTATSAYS